MKSQPRNERRPVGVDLFAGAGGMSLGFEQAVGEAIPLGDPKLLTMEMSHAAEFWGIACPIQKRDRKSGARKRTQQETELERLFQVAI